MVARYLSTVTTTDVVAWYPAGEPGGANERALLSDNTTNSVFWSQAWSVGGNFELTCETTTKVISWTNFVLLAADSNPSEPVKKSRVAKRDQ